MSRNLNAAVTSISQLESTRFRLLCDVYSLSTGTTRACLGNNYILFNGNTYSPVGNLGGIDPIQEESDVFPRAVKLWFAAVDTSTIQDVLTENMFNKPVRIYRTFLTDSFTCVSTPETIFVGRINTCDMKLKDPERGDFFEIEVESKLARPKRALRFNSETLKVIFLQTSNTLFDHVTKIPLTKANWGGMTIIGNGAPAGGRRGNTDGPRGQRT